MAGKSQEDILRFYEDFRQRGGWEFLEGMRVFLPRLFRERDLSELEFLTSHATLCISRFPYPKCLEQPGLFLNCTAKDRLHLELQVPVDSGPVARTLKETVNCPIDLGLQAFDRLYAKFIAAHMERPSGGEV
jgi:hypothetical protein